MKMRKGTKSEANDGENQTGEEESLTEKEKMAETEATGDKSGGNSGFEPKNHPPEDDCCAICFGRFDVPSRTNCGHWFCSACFLQYWHHSEGIKACTCPFCGNAVTKLIPYAPLLVQPEERVQKILKQVEDYNRLDIVGYVGIFWRALAMALLIRRRFLELHPDVAAEIVTFLCFLVTGAGLLAASIYAVCGFDFIPYGPFTIIMCSQAYLQVVVLAIYADRINHAHDQEMLQAEAMLLAEQGVPNQPE